MNYRLYGAAALFAVVLQTGLPAFAQNPAATITVDVTANRKAINPQIYGLSAAGTAMLNDLNVPLNRAGGNNTTRYNWQLNADNRAFDWYFQSLPYSSSVAGEGGDTFVAESKAAGAQPMITVPIIGWVAKLGPNRGRLSSFSIAKYGAQQDADWQWFPDAGNGVLAANGQFVVNDPNDASTLVTSTFQQNWVTHLVNKWGNAANGGVRYYILDNEHSIWHSTHRDVHPTGASMDEIRNKMIDHATKIKAADPGALVVGPEEWGWSGYIFSGLDQQTGASNGWSFFPDRSSHGNMDYLPWLLDQFRQHQQSTGTRLLDVFTVHYYPQGGEYSNTVSTAMQQRRNRSTRSLWDPNYTDETWIADKVRLIPRLKQWVNTYYPNTPIGITEYNWGAEGHINGATALADVLGIFGREGLDMATYWTYPGSTTPTYKAIKMYRNYDGAKSTFGDVSVSAGGPNPDNVAVFAAQRSSDNKVTVMVINKYLSGNTPVTINLQHFAAGGVAQVWQLTSSNTIARLADVASSTGSITATVPPQSITLFVVPAAAAVQAKRFDFNADSRADILLRNTNTGENYLYPMNGTAIAAGEGYIRTVAAPWTLAGIGDFDGNGTADLLWRNTTTGENYVYFMNGTSIASEGYIRTVPLAWSVAGVADLDGDGRADILLRNTTTGENYLYPMDGFTIKANEGYIRTVPSPWTIAGLADFNNDGRADILLRNTSTGENYVYPMNGTAILAGEGYIRTVAAPWTLAGIGDFDGNGTADLFWRNTSTGENYFYFMNGTAISSEGYIRTVPLAWSVASVADFNGDGRADILLRNTSTGENYLYPMNGTAILGTEGYVRTVPTSWTIVSK
jgi:hypothetical protein